MTQKQNIGIIDYGSGNIISLSKAIIKAGFKPIIIKEYKKEIELSSLILPGVGNMKFAMKMLKKKNLVKFILDNLNNNTQIIGICLGAQILFEKSEEGKSLGLGLIPGSVKLLPLGKFHIGWNKTWFNSKKNFISDTDFYFNHRYYIECDENFIFQKTFFEIEIPAIIKYKNFWGLQFHPEKSQLNGLKLLNKILGQSYV